QRIESEQRCHNKLHSDSYHQLKDALPISNQKLSKVSLLDYAITHVKYQHVCNSNLREEEKSQEG
ncbi:hypothetical protein HD554DRAFT_2019287, partial [Boletus coccyginus]